MMSWDNEVWFTGEALEAWTPVGTDMKGRPKQCFNLSSWHRRKWAHRPPFNVKPESFEAAQAMPQLIFTGKPGGSLTVCALFGTPNILSFRDDFIGLTICRTKSMHSPYCSRYLNHAHHNPGSTHVYPQIMWITEIRSPELIPLLVVSFLWISHDTPWLLDLACGKKSF